MTNDTITIKAPAKINLSLDVTGRRENGYHDLRMLMQTIDLYDELTIKKTAEPGIYFSMNRELPDHIPPEKNLVWKAAKLLQERCHITDGIDIYLKKNIPAAAGLAGGSSDCAAALIGINELCGLGLTLGQLCSVLSPERNNALRGHRRDPDQTSGSFPSVGASDQAGHFCEYRLRLHASEAGRDYVPSGHGAPDRLHPPSRRCHTGKRTFQCT